MDDPDGNKVGSVPKFTGNIDDAKSLLDLVLPNASGGLSFHGGFAKATVDGGDAVTAFNAATALSLATIKAGPDENR